MPHLNIQILIERLQAHAFELHDIYVACKDISLSERILNEVFKLEAMVETLKTLI